MLCKDCAKSLNFEFERIGTPNLTTTMWLLRQATQKIRKSEIPSEAWHSLRGVLKKEGQKKALCGGNSSPNLPEHLIHLKFYKEKSDLKDTVKKLELWTALLKDRYKYIIRTFLKQNIGKPK